MVLLKQKRQNYLRGMLEEEVKRYCKGSLVVNDGCVKRCLRKDIAFYR
jgi:hypothetical protein